MGIPWLKINNTNSFFLQNYNSLISATILYLDKTAVGYVGDKNVGVLFSNHLQISFD